MPKRFSEESIIKNGIKILFIAIKSNFAPSLGIGNLSAFLKKKIKNIQVSVSWLSADILSEVENQLPDIIGISCTSRYFKKFKQIAYKLKKIFNIPIIWGGVHISLAPYELPQYVDIGVVGEGERTLEELLLNFVNGHFINLEKIKGIIYWDNKEIMINEKRPLLKTLDDIPFPDWDLLQVNWNNSNRAVLITSRGCPYKCRFCASSMLWDKIRYHSAEYVVNSIKIINDKYNINEILIYDDLFTINRNRLAKIAELIKLDSNLNHIRFECLSRVDTFDEFIATQLKKIGIYRVSFGIESGSQKTLNYLKNKTLKLSQVINALNIARFNGFECVASFIIGSPYETIEDIKESLDFIKKLNLTSVQITIATPFPGTQLWKDGKKVGKILGDGWLDDYYILYNCVPNVLKILHKKKLLTQISFDEFYNLVERAINLSKKINHPFRLKLILKSGKQNPLKFAKSFLNLLFYRALRILSQTEQKSFLKNISKS